MPSKNPDIHFRLTDEEKTKLQIIAHNEGRSVSNQVAWIVRRFITPIPIYASRSRAFAEDSKKASKTDAMED